MAMTLSAMLVQPMTGAEMLPPVLALASSVSSLAAATLTVLATPCLAQQLGQAASDSEPCRLDAVGDLESGRLEDAALADNLKNGMTLTGLATPPPELSSARAVRARLTDALRPRADALHLTSHQVVLLIAVLYELSRNRAHWSRKPDETWGRFLQALHEILLKKNRPMMPAEAWYEVSEWYSSLSTSRLTSLLKAALRFRSCPEPKEALKLAQLLEHKVSPRAKTAGSIKMSRSL